MNRKAVLFGLSGFGNTALRALRRAEYDVGLVLTRREPGPFPYYEERRLADEARELGIEVLESPDLGDKVLKARIDAYAPDLLLSATFSVAIPHRFLGVPGRTCLGVHPSLLPAYRGATPTTWLVLNQEPQFCGVTLHHLTPKAFVGDIVAQRPLAPDPRDTDGTLRRRLAEVAGEIVFEAAAVLGRGEALARVVQDETRITFFPPRMRRDGLIKFDEPTRNIFDRIRAVLPYPGAFTYWGEREVEILGAELEETGTFEVQPGLVMRRSGDGVVVKTRDGALRVKTQPALTAADLDGELVVFTDHHKIGIPKKGLRDTIVHTRETYGIDTGAEEFPKMVVLATVYPCNAKCPNCPYTETNSDIRMKYSDAPFMDAALFRKIADECGPHRSFVRITGGGEPMMHPADMASLIEYAKSVGARVWLNTNGSLMPKDKIDRLLACGLDQVEFSVDAADPTTYDVVRAGLDWDNLLMTVRAMVAERDRRKAVTNVVVSVINQDIVRDSMDDIVRFWLEQGVDEVIKRKFLTWGSNTALDPQRSADPTPYLDKTEGEPCPYPFHRLNIDSRGKVEVCGFDISGRTNLGNVREQTIAEIWKGPMFEWWRGKHAAREGGDIPLCRECPDWQYRSWTHNWEKVMRTAKAHRLRVIEWAEHETGAPGAGSRATAVYAGRLVTLRAFEKDDAEAYRAWVNDAEVASLVDRAKPVTRLEHERWYEALVSSETAAVFAVEDRRRSKLIGLVWLYGIRWRHRVAEVRVLIGDRKAWGTGRGTEALQVAVDVAFGPMNLEKLWADVLVSNPRGVAAFEKAGFGREGLLRGDRVVAGKRVDVVRLGLVRDTRSRSRR